MVREKVKPLGSPDEASSIKNELILFNDEVNSFDYVIETLMDICEHEQSQAEQCALIAHYNGKCPVRSGAFSELKPMHDGMSSRGLTVSIE